MADLKSIATNEQIEDFAKKVAGNILEKASKDVFHKFYDDIIKWLFQHHSNFQDRIFDEVSKIICEDYKSLHFRTLSARKLRLKIYEENKEQIENELIEQLYQENEKLGKKNGELEKTIEKYESRYF